MTRPSAPKRPDRFDDENNGPIEAAVRRDLDEIGLSASMGDSYAEICFNLARKLDNGAGMASAAIAKELRDTLQVIEEAAGDNHSSDLLNALNAPVLAPVRDTA